MKQPSDSDMADIRAFIASVEWQFAKTMPWCPHYYNILDWNPEKRNGFFKLVTAIFEHGYQQEWPPPDATGTMATCRKRIVTYFNVDGYKYWVMDPTIEETSLINRAELPDEGSRSGGASGE